MTNAVKDILLQSYNQFHGTDRSSLPGFFTPYETCNESIRNIGYGTIVAPVSYSIASVVAAAAAVVNITFGIITGFLCEPKISALRFSESKDILNASMTFAFEAISSPFKLATRLLTTLFLALTCCLANSAPSEEPMDTVSARL